MTTRRRQTGEQQRTRQPFNIDRLPPHVRESIELLKNHYGKTWEQIEALSAERFPAKASLVPLGGFVDWDKLDTEVIELFPGRRIPKSNLQRWYDVRVRQVFTEVMHKSAQARELATAFAKAAIDGADEAVLNACRDTIMGVLSEDGSAAGRAKAARSLLQLAEVQQAARANDIKERKVAAEERKLKLVEKREAIAIQKLEAETERLSKKASAGQPITAEDLAEVRRRTFGF
jgi:hypothetical protein